MTVALLAAAYATYLVHFFDSAAITWMRGDGAWLAAWLGAPTSLGKFHWYMMPALGIGLAVAVTDWEARSRRGKAFLTLCLSQALFSLTALILSFTASNLVKIAVGRARPLLLEQHGAAHFSPLTAGYAFASFPSGHATACGTVAAILAIWFPARAVPFGCIFLVLAASRVAAKAHYPSDVIAGFALGFIGTLYLGRWLGSRHLGFRLPKHRLLPLPRFAGALRARPAGRLAHPIS